jgi:hypothetical protein
MEASFEQRVRGGFNRLRFDAIELRYSCCAKQPHGFFAQALRHSFEITAAE